MIEIPKGHYRLAARITIYPTIDVGEPTVSSLVELSPWNWEFDLNSLSEEEVAEMFEWVMGKSR